jgi:MFS family permease
MGSIMGLLAMGHSLGMLLGPILAGIMMDAFQLGMGFIVGTAVMVLGVIVSLVLTANFQTLVKDST